MSAASVARVLAGLVLLAAAVLKAYALSTTPAQDGRLWALAQVEAEALLGVWLVSGLAPRAARLMGIITFGLIAIVALVLTIRSDASCGCFGHLPVPPWGTLALDMVIVAALILARPAAVTSRAAYHVRLFASGLACVSLVLGLLWLAQPRISTLAGDGSLAGDRQLVVLEPDIWVRQSFPLLPHLPNRDELQHGSWSLLFYHHGCPDCEKALGKMLTSAEEQVSVGARYAVVDVSEQAAPLHLPGEILVQRLPEDRQWFVRTPVVVTLHDGIVIAVGGDAATAHGPSQVASQPPTTALANAPVVRARKLEMRSYVADLGYVPSGGSKRVLVQVEGWTEQDQPIKEVLSECSCLAVQGHSAAAGGGRTISLRFDAPADVGPYAKKLLILPSGSETDPVEVLIRARVGMPLSIVPESIHLDQLRQRPVDLAVHNEGDEPVRLVYATSSVLGVVVRVPQDAVPAHGAVSLLVEATATLTTASDGTLRLHTDLRHQPFIELPVR